MYDFRFSEAIVDYLSNIGNVPDPSVTEGHFSKEIDAAHDYLFSNWLTKSSGSTSSTSAADFNVRHSVIEVIFNLISLDQNTLFKQSRFPSLRGKTTH